MQMKEDNKVTLKLENGDTECVLLKHGPPAEMNAEFEKFSEVIRPSPNNANETCFLRQPGLQGGQAVQQAHLRTSLKRRGLW